MNYRTVFHNLGNILMIEGGFLLLPVLVSVIYREKTGIIFAGTAVAAFLAGILLHRYNMEPAKLRAREGFVTVGLSWIVMSIVGAMPYYLSGEIPVFVDALFECVSGFTTTGGTVVLDVEALSRCTLFWRSLTHWLGGMGILVFMLAIMPLREGTTIHLLRAESAGPSVSKSAPRMRTSVSMPYFVYIVLTVSEAVLLKLGGMTLFDCINYAMSTAGTGGFGVHSSGVGAYDSVYINVVVTVFMFLFGLNFGAYLLLLAGKPKEIFKNTEIKVYFLTVAAAILSISFCVRGCYDSVGETVMNTAFTVSSSISSTGFSITNYDVWPLYPKIVLILLMIMGGCTGSTCGSMKICRVIILVKSAYANILRLVNPRQIRNVKMDGKTIEKETIADVNAFVSIYIFITAISLLLVSLDGYDLVTTGSAVVATVNNIGIGFRGAGPTGSFAIFSPFSKLVMCFNMIAGRLEIFPLIILLMPRTWKRREIRRAGKRF